MLKLSVDEIINYIDAERCFEAVADDYSFSLKITEYTPHLCAAVHDGHQFRKPLWEKCLHSEYERWYEEDPCTLQMINSQPMVLAGRDSRFEYDLNREPERAIYEDAWGKKLWKTALSPEEKEQSLFKHQQFYRVVKALITKIESKFGSAWVVDMHSYNWKRWDRRVPVWNLGTSNIHPKYRELTQKWSTILAEIKLPGKLKSTSAINDTFQGNGYFLKFITANFRNTLVLATEIAKVYCDEENYIIYPEIVRAVESQIPEKIEQMSYLFSDKQLI